MLRDVFYFGEKPNVHPRERHAIDIDEARKEATTEHFWIINEFCDYTAFDWEFDFDFLPDEDVWAEEHNNIWPSQHQKDSGTWLCSQELSDIRVYRADVAPIKRKSIKNNCWKLFDKIDEDKFDFSWHPDPSDPPFIYVWGSKFATAEQKSVIEYHTEGNVGHVKYMNTIVELEPLTKNWKINEPINESKVDFTWRPDPLDTEPFIYIWGSKWAPAEQVPIMEYHVPGNDGTIKYIDTPVELAVDMSTWEVLEEIEDGSFDFTWRPDPNETELFNYVFGNQLYDGTIMPTLIYKVEGAKAVKHVTEYTPKLKSKPELFGFNEDIEMHMFDFSWRPNPTSPPYIYAWGNQWNKVEDKVSIEFKVEGATEYQFMPETTVRMPSPINWTVPDNIQKYSFDFSWEPNPNEPAMIHEFATQHQKTGGPIYTVPGATETKYENIFYAIALPTEDKWEIPDNINKDLFDFSWHPDSTEPVPYIYHFPTQWAMSGGPIYRCDDAEEVKYVDAQQATAYHQMCNWEFDPKVIDESTFYFSWHPYAEDEPYIYQFGTQWQKTGGPKYITPGVHEGSAVKYIDTRILKATRLANANNFKVLNDYCIKGFDFSWHPDDTSDPFIYQFGNQYYSAEQMPTLEYRVIGADEVSYVNDLIATLGHDKTNWEIPTDIDVSEFDFSWKPNPNEPAMIHEFGTQWQKTGGPRYYVEGATEVKYEEQFKAVALSKKDNWTIPNNIDEKTFDFSWHPDATSPPYIYRFPTQWALSGGPIYTVEDAEEVKYVEDQVSKALPCKDNWEVDSKLIDEDDFDYSWHPYAEDEPFIYQFGTQWQKTGGHKYITPGAHEGTGIKYIDTRIIKSKRLPDPNNRHWGTLGNYQIKDFDYSWHHDETDEPFVYQFGNKYYSAEEMPTIEYRVVGAETVKYVHDVVATLEESVDGWEISDDLDTTGFDFGWRPSPLEDQPYIYQFGTQWQKTGGPKYIVEGALEVKYVEGNIAHKLPNQPCKWTIPEGIDIDGFDFSWHPDDLDEPFIYQFGTQWALTGGPTYTVDGATKIKYIEQPVATSLDSGDRTNWKVPQDIEDFDFSWHPYAEDDPFIYQFGTQHQKTGGPTYTVDGATDIKYVDTRIIKARKLANSKRMHWVVPGDLDVSKFDFSWHPDETADPAIYQFGSVVGKDDGPKYVQPGNDGNVLFLQTIEADNVIPDEIDVYFIDTTLEDLVAQHPDEVFWALNMDLVYTDFDFSWRPDVYQSNYIHAFGSKDNINTQTYFVNSAIFKDATINYVETDTIGEIQANLDMFYVDRGNKESKERFAKLQERYPNIQKTRYLNSWVETARRCINRSTTSLLWILNSELDYEEFDFDYYPNPWQMKMVHVFGTQWSHWGTTYLIARETFNDDTKYINVIEHLDNLNFVKDIRARATECVYDVVVVDHGNKHTEAVVKQLQEKAPRQRVSTVEHDTDYLTTLKNIVDKLPTRKEHYVWIASSICDYGDFDLSYICDPFARDQLHVFPSNKQKFGDTFFIDVNKTRELIDDMESLEDYEKINYNQTLRTQRLRAPVIVSKRDTHTKSLKDIDEFPYVTLVSKTDEDIQVVDEEPMSLWTAESKNIIVQSTGATRIIVPREVKDHVKRELYEYPYIKNANRLALSKPMDIVFLSNGETGAEENWEHLQRITKNIPNRVVRVDGVDGRVQAYHASAEASETPWAFTVFAKLKVSPKFDFNWQPDRMQQPKHYIFEAKNPVNGLVYGHQAMIAYNKELTLANYGYGLDFTLDDEHASVPLLSGIAQYNTDEFSTWRTAFREVIKLLVDDTEISKKRLEAWLNEADPDQPFFQESIKGAICGEEYFEEVDGDFEKLRLSYEWKWLKERYEEVSY